MNTLDKFIVACLVSVCFFSILQLVITILMIGRH
jgi:hypothetical protein